jgi:hypothetical protein
MINVFSLTSDAVHYAGRIGRVLLLNSIEDTTQFASHVPSRYVEKCL